MYILILDTRGYIIFSILNGYHENFVTVRSINSTCTNTIHQTFVQVLYLIARVFLDWQYFSPGRNP